MESKFLFLPVIVFFTACSHLSTLEDYNSEEEYYQHITQSCSGEKVLIELQDSTKTVGYSLEIKIDSLQWLDPDNKTVIQPISNINSISHKLNTEGAVNGLLTGACIGVLVSVSAGGSDLGKGVNGTIGAIVGSIVWGIIGVKETFIINNF